MHPFGFIFSGAPHRVNGKVRGSLSVGGTLMQLDSIDLHAYIVVGDGRAYTAISEVPEPVGWALMPVAPIGGLFGWLFALELPNSLNGFSITGEAFMISPSASFMMLPVCSTYGLPLRDFKHWGFVLTNRVPQHFLRGTRGRFQGPYYLLNPSSLI